MNKRFHLSWTITENCLDKKQVIVDMINYIFQYHLTPNPSIIYITDEDPIKVTKFDRELLTELVEENEYAIELQNETNSFAVVTILLDPDSISVFFSQEQLEVWDKDWINLFRYVISSDIPTLTLRCYFSTISSDIHTRHYMSNRRTFLSPGLVWLQYYAHEELERQGGREAIKQNPYIQYEEIGEGILVQVGDSPYDAYTKEGEELLVRATKAMPPVVEV